MGDDLKTMDVAANPEHVELAKEYTPFYTKGGRLRTEKVTEWFLRCGGIRGSEDKG